MSHRRQIVCVLLALSVASFVVALVLAHVSSHQTLQGEKSTNVNDPDARTEPTSVEVECASAASGPRLDGNGSKTGVNALDNSDGIHEDNGYDLDNEGISIDEVSDVCGRIRTERLTHAVELGVLGLLLGGSAVLLVRDARGRSEDDEEEKDRWVAPPPPTREERTRGVL